MSSSKKETERAKYIEEKCQNLLTQMLKDEDNKYCVDCDAKGPRWASYTLGVFLCIRCAGIHRNLGVHISRVRSVNLDSWTPEQVVSLQQMGNSRARAVYEAQLPDGFRRPQTDSALESFIRAKYEHKKYMAREWVPPPPPKVDWDKEIDEELEKQKRKKKSIATGIGSLASPNVDKKVSSSKPTPIPAPLPKPKSTSHSPKSGRILADLSTANSPSSSAVNNNNASLDLLGLSSPPATTSISNGLLDGGKASSSSLAAVDQDDFNNFFSSAPTPAKVNGVGTAEVKKEVNGNGVEKSSNLAKEEADFFNQSVPSEAEKAKLTKDSIMALYASQPMTNAALLGNAYPQAQQQPPVQQQQQFMGHFAGLGIVNHQTTTPQQFNNFKMAPNHHQSPQNGMMGAQQGFQPGFGMPQPMMNPNFPNMAMPQANPMMNKGGFPVVGQNMQFPTQAFGPMNPVASNQFLPPQTVNHLSASGQPQNPAQSSSLNQQFGSLNLGNVWQ